MTDAARPRMVFHAPYPLNREATSASGIRPVRMRDAFEALGYEVWEVTGYTPERRAAARRVLDALERGERFEFCYSESSTMPTSMTDPDHLPRHPLFDFALMRALRTHGCRVGLFYRDIYWRFPDYGTGLNPARRQAALAMYRHDLRSYRSATDVLFLPSEQMAKHLGSLDGLRVRALPPGHDVAPEPAVAPSPLHLLYVGGLTVHYRLHALMEAIAQVPDATLTICCREAEWAAAQDEYGPLPPNVEVVHRSGEGLAELYQRANLAVIFAEPVPYWTFAAPVKLYEYLGHGKPMIASQGTLAGSFVAESGLGWTLPYEPSALVDLLHRLQADPSELERVQQHVAEVAPQHTWLGRARQVVRDLTGEEVGDRAADVAAGTGRGVRSVVLVSTANSIHTARWANALAERGLEVHLASVHQPADQTYDERVHLHLLPNPRGAGYLSAAPAVRRIITDVAPDLVNSHYASGYGTLATLALTGLDVPHLVSVWGSDVYDFPVRNAATRRLLERNLAEATLLASTSRSMAEHTRQYAGPREIAITSFGIDLDRFPVKDSAAPDPGAPVVVGTVKTLKAKYGIDTLIEAFAMARKVVGPDALVLRIVGGGPDEAELKDLARRLGVADAVEFTGAVPHEQVPEQLRALDVYVALSRLDSESFGVAILEASATGLPVVVSDAAGPAEVTEEGETGFIVPRDDPRAAADAIVRLVQDPALRARMGAAGRRHVEEHYAWEHSVDDMLTAYARTVELARQHRA